MFETHDTFETGPCDHLYLVYSMLKTCFKREESKHFIYRDCKNFNDTDFRMDLGEINMRNVQNITKILKRHL